nr:hypothetical protein [Paenibacillus polymyxa]
MRLFELLLLLSNIGLFALTVLLKKERSRIPVFVASEIATLLLVIHWTMEGYRVQLFFPYCITIIFLAISGYSYFKKSGPTKNLTIHVGFSLYRYSDNSGRNSGSHACFSCI